VIAAAPESPQTSVSISVGSSSHGLDRFEGLFDRLEPRLVGSAERIDGHRDVDRSKHLRVRVLDRDESLRFEDVDGVVHPRSRHVADLTDLSGGRLWHPRERHETPRFVGL